MKEFFGLHEVLPIRVNGVLKTWPSIGGSDPQVSTSQLPHGDIEGYTTIIVNESDREGLAQWGLQYSYDGGENWAYIYKNFNLKKGQLIYLHIQGEVLYKAAPKLNTIIGDGE